MIFCQLGLWSVKQRDLCNMVLYHKEKVNNVEETIQMVCKTYIIQLA